jgi:hypothetical protein
VPSTNNPHPENSKENLDRKLDHAIEETFPTSDPVSVTITKGGAIDYGSPADAAASSAHQEGLAPDLIDRTKETISDLAGSASEAAREAYRQGARYVDELGERYPSAERYYREGTDALRQTATENPMLTLAVGVMIGYALARLVHGSGSGDTNQRGRFSAERPEQDDVSELRLIL